MTDADREIKRLISYIRSCREANIDCTVTIDKRLTHCVLNALEEVQQYRAIGTVEECREAVERRKPKQAVFDCMIGILGGRFRCPVCRKVILHDYRDTENTFCERCGQVIQWDENLDGMEDETDAGRS